MIVDSNLIDLQFYKQTENSFSGTDILSKTVALMKPTKSLVTVPSSLWTRYLIKIIYMRRFALTCLILKFSSLLENHVSLLPC